MTRKLLSLTGAAGTAALCLILVFSILAPSRGFTLPTKKINFSSEEEYLPVNSVHTTSRNRASEEDVLAALDQKTNPAAISGLNLASPTATLYGMAPEHSSNLTASSSKETLSSLVLASRIASDELGRFEVNYSITPEEYEMLLYCVDHETRSGSLEHRILIAQVIMNRVMSNRFANTVSAVVLAPHQFSVMPRYEEKKEGWTPKEMTRQAVDMVLNGCSPDYAQGAIYFCNPYKVGDGNWFDEKLTVICELEGHRFYK